MAEILNKVSIISYILAGLFFIISIFLWIKFKIPVIIGDLTGRTAKKSIDQRREKNENVSAKIYKTNLAKIEKRAQADVHIRNGTELETGVLNENTVRDADVGVQTGILNNEITEILDKDVTTVLDDEAARKRNEIVKNTGFTVLEEVMLIHTEEVIP